MSANGKVHRIGGPWGNNIRWTDANNYKVAGEMIEPPAVGEFLMSKMQSGRAAVFCFTEVDAKGETFTGKLDPVGYYKDGEIRALDE